MLAAAVGSYFATPKSVHAANEFSFAPAKEVGWLFLGIFLTMVPVLDYMQLHARDLAIDTPARILLDHRRLVRGARQCAHLPGVPG